MKLFLKTFLIVCSISLLSLVLACSGDDDEKVYESTAQIIGPDLALCICCGGWILEIENDSSVIRTEAIPDSWFDCLDNNELPKTIKMNWTFNRDCAGFTYIDVDEFVFE